MKKLLRDIRSCEFCKEHLPLGPRPIVSGNNQSKIILVSQAPGRLAHESGIAWDDPSGRQLRNWLGVDDQTFYNPNNFAVLPTGFCYPGKGVTGDLPPRPECAPLWHESVWNEFKNVKLIILIGAYSQNYYLKNNNKRNLTETVASYKEYLPKYFPIPHPSPVNRFWLSKNKWFVENTVPELQMVIESIL